VAVNEPASLFAMSDTAAHALEAIGSLLASGIAIIYFWIRLSDRISTAESKAEAANSTALNAFARIIKAEADLVDHRVMVAAEYVSKTTLAEMRTELLSAINRLSDQFISTFKGSH
jgi:hypothetical protein